MKRKTNIYLKFSIAIVLPILFVLYYLNVFSTKYTSEINDFQERFTRQEVLRDKLLFENSILLDTLSKRDIWKKVKKEKGFFVHIYKDDSLIYWSSNQLPILRFADIHFPSEGVIHLQNGWYYSRIQKSGSYQICTSFLIKRDYVIENTDLKNEFSTSLKLPFSAYITFEQENGYPIYSKNKKYLFSISPNNYQPANQFESILLYILLIGSLLIWIQLFFEWCNSFKFKWVFPIVLIVSRVLSIEYVLFGFMHTTDAFNPTLYGSNKYFASFFDYSLNVIILIYLALFIRAFIKQIIRKIQLKKMMSYLALYIGFIVYFIIWIGILFLNKGLVENSSISLVLEKLFSLNFYSIITVGSIGIIFFIYYLLGDLFIEYITKIKLEFNIGLVVVLISSCIVYLIIQRTFFTNIWLTDLFPILLIGILFVNYFTFKHTSRLTFYLLILLLFAIVETLTLNKYNRVKEKGERIFYANQLATEKDILTEVEYSKIAPKIKEDNAILRLIHSPRKMNLSDFDDMLERKLFNGFWERYEMSFNLFSENNKSIINPLEDNSRSDFEELNQIVDRHGSPSEIDSNIYFINDYIGHYSYIIRQPIYDVDSNRFTLFCTLRSKKIPEEIGFPRLLISTKANVFESLKNYSIAKYFNNHLVTKYGNFNYPTSHLAIINWKDVKSGFYNYEGYNHYLLKKTDYNITVVSSKKVSWIELVTSVAYLFCLFGLILLPFILFVEGKSGSSFTVISLSSKIQVVLISMVFLSLFAFGWGSGLFVKNQYDDYTEDLIREKLNSVDLQMLDRLGKAQNLTIEEDGNSIELLLQNLAKVFITDVNLYDKDGFLLGTSRSKLFNIGLLSEQMNASAFYQMDVRNKSEYIHKESIGALEFSSAYAPFYNDRGNFLAYLNLQHFGQQKEFEIKIQQFLIAIINVFMLLLTFSIVVAIIISNWVTSPLRLIQESFSNIQFGRHNKPIIYDKKDEIGALVQNYNQKLEELEITASQLAQSERESAWREMAKQVAHEIKNPLTPMKLSIQHLLRTFDSNDPDSKIKLDRVASSLVEQIDGLAKIANEFSSFAKLPQPIDDHIDLLPYIRGVVDIFSKENQVILETNLVCVNIFADKDLMIRVFNNLIKNAIQAIQTVDNGKVIVRVSKFNSNYWFEVIDNGTGIEPEIKEKIFVPYFTTKGTGTGLGLAMVKQIINNQRGDINFLSEEGETVFKFYLPEVF